MGGVLFQKPSSAEGADDRSGLPGWFESEMAAPDRSGHLTGREKKVQKL